MLHERTIVTFIYNLNQSILCFNKRLKYLGHTVKSPISGFIKKIVKKTKRRNQGKE